MKIKIPEMEIELNELALRFIEAQGLQLTVAKIPTTDPLETLEKLAADDKEKPQEIKKEPQAEEQKAEPQKEEPKEDIKLNGFRVFEQAFNRFVDARKGAFNVSDIRNYMDENKIPWVEGYYSMARKQVMGLSLDNPLRVEVFNPDAPNSIRKYIKRKELLAIREGEKKVKEREAGGEKKKESVMISVDPANY